MTRKFNVAILGATGAVGQAMLKGLETRNFPVENLYLLASERSVDKTYRFNGKSIQVADVEQFDWSNVDIALFSAGGDLSAKWAPIAGDNGVVVIDNSSHFRYELDVPLVIPEVNPEMIAEYRNRNIIANPNCSTIQMLVALKPIYDLAGIERINVSTYQSVSGAGQTGLNELAGQTSKLLNGAPADIEVFSEQIAFNCIPHIDEMLENGYTKEEMKMVWETKKIFNNPHIEVNPTCVRVPVFYGHAESVHIETTDKITIEQAQDALSHAKSITISEDLTQYPTQIKSLEDSDEVCIGRLREDISHPQGINMWIVSDNVRKGAATNAIQIAEILVNEYL